MPTFKKSHTHEETPMQIYVNIYCGLANSFFLTNENVKEENQKEKKKNRKKTEKK